MQLTECVGKKSCFIYPKQTVAHLEYVLNVHLCCTLVARYATVKRMVKELLFMYVI